ncbi:MAG TPA: hypothetical protein VK709_02955 [Candidatus Saccharimonadales bacterium]|jgi:hypothetical protein|nr:hypothetical protein [Candidatus Saccharimonadales bacterium]
MSLSISQQKIDELLQYTAPPYVVTSSHITLTSPAEIEQEPLVVSGTIFNVSLFTAETKQNLLDLRRKIVDSQVPLASEDALEDEIGRMRDRKLR